MVKRWGSRIVLALLLALALLILFADRILRHYAAGYKVEVETLLSTALHARVTIGLLTPQLTPFPELSAEDLVVEDLTGADPIKISRIKFRLSLLPLLSRKLVIQKVSMTIPEYNLATSGKAIEVRNLNLRAQLDLSHSAIDLHDLTLTGSLNNLPLKLLGGPAHFDPQTAVLQLDPAILTVGTNRFELSGLFQLREKQLDISLPNFSLQPATLQALTSLISPEKPSQLPSGTISGSLSLKGSELKNLNLHGDIALKNFSGRNFTLADATLNDLALTLSNGKPISGKVNLSLKTVRVNYLTDKYEADSIRGKLELAMSKPGETSVTGSLDAQKFGFTDGTTTLKDVVATLSPIKITSAASGDISAQVNVNGSRVALNHPVIQVIDAQRVTAPLIISIPARGGYKITGPVTTTAAQIDLLKHLLKNVSGEVKLLITGPEKSFSSQGVKFEVNNIPSKIAANFRMLPKEFLLTSAETNYFAGSLKLNGKLARSGAKSFSIESNAKNLSLQRVLALISSDSNLHSPGTIELFSSKLTGELNNFPQSITGTGELQASQPQAAKTRLTGKILEALRRVPLVGQLFGSKEISELADQQIITAKLKFENSACYFEQAKLDRDAYDVNATGKLGFDKILDLKADVVLLSKTAASLGFGIGPLKRLFGRAGSIIIPIFIRGKLPDVQVEADIKTFIKNNSGIGLGEDILRGIGSTIGL